MSPAFFTTALHRHRRSAAALIAAFTSIALWAMPVAAQSTLRFVDQDGEALRDVVVWTPSDAPGAPSRESAGQRSNLPQQPRTEIDQRNKRFEPYVSVVQPGTDVFFPNSDDIRHHVYSFSAGNAFERKLYRANEADPVRLQNPGIVALGCNIHDNMQAYVVVSDEPVIVSDENGELSIPKETQRLRIWHPLLGDKEIDTRLSELEAVAEHSYVLRLPFVWSDPQAPRSDAQLESLLKQFSRDPQ